MQSYDLIVIGSGPAGQRAAIQAAKSGRKAAVIEQREIVGGMCITMPSGAGMVGRSPMGSRPVGAPVFFGSSRGGGFGCPAF